MKLISEWMPTVAPRWVGKPIGWAMLLLVSWFSVESSFLVSTAKAQVVVVGPAGGVRVRAPFVSVDVLPFHRGTRLRVPYAAINTGFYRSYRSLPPVPRFFHFRSPIPTQLLLYRHTRSLRSPPILLLSIRKYQVMNTRV